MGNVAIPHLVSPRKYEVLVRKGKLRNFPGPIFAASIMGTTVRHIINNHTFWLSQHRLIYWEQENTLILSDLHFGKAAHFRKSGIPVPQNVFKEDLQCLFDQVQFYKPKQLIIVGDLFHSRENKEMDLFIRWRNDIAHIDIHLVKGNHDILKDSWYTQAGVTISDTRMKLHNFCFIHDIADANETEDGKDAYYFSGHIHPGIAIKSGIRQSLSFPCFYFGKQFAVLPAFGRFTGLATIKPKPGDAVYAIINSQAKKSVIKVQ